MPISRKAFDSSPDSVNPKLMDLFIKHPDRAYSYSELKKKFGDFSMLDLLILLMSNKIETKSLGGESFYRLTKK